MTGYSLRRNDVPLGNLPMGNVPSIPAWSINSSSSNFLVLCFTEQGIVSPLKEGYVESILFKTLPTLGQG